MLQLYTMGHSTLPSNDFLDIVKKYEIQHLIDIRHYPGSRKHPQYKKDTMCEWLNDNDIKYTHIESLGGRRRLSKSEKNAAWTSLGFRGYADYMETPEWLAGCEELNNLASQELCCIMCSEVLWWRCHRRLVADYFKINLKYRVLDIFSINSVVEHPNSDPVGIKNGVLDYSGKYSLSTKCC